MWMLIITNMIFHHKKKLDSEEWQMKFLLTRGTNPTIIRTNMYHDIALLPDIIQN